MKIESNLIRFGHLSMMQKLYHNGPGPAEKSRPVRTYGTDRTMIVEIRKQHVIQQSII